MKPVMKSKTPDVDDANALIAAHQDLIDHFNSPELPNRHIAIVEFGVTQVVRVEGGEEQATTVVKHIELLSNTVFAQDGEDLLLRAYRLRTKNNVLPSAAATDQPLDLSGLELEGPVPAAPTNDDDAAFDAAAPSNVTTLHP